MKCTSFITHDFEYKFQCMLLQHPISLQFNHANNIPASHPFVHAKTQISHFYIQHDNIMVIILSDSRLWSKIKFGSLIIESGGETMISFDAIHYCKNFGQLNLPLSIVDFYFRQLSLAFFYCQNKLESISTVHILNVTTCFYDSTLSNVNENQRS